MKKSYRVLIAIMALALLAVFLYSQSDSLSEMIGLKKGKFNETLFAEKKSKEVKTAPADTAATKKQPGKNEMDTTSKTILFIGDSMVECLFPRMSAYAKKNGHTFYAVIWYSATSEVYGTRTTIKEYIDKYKPNYIIFSLGGNELFVRDIKDNRQRYVDEIIRQFGDIPYVWIGPPNWCPRGMLLPLLYPRPALRPQEGWRPPRQAIVDTVDGPYRQLDNEQVGPSHQDGETCCWRGGTT